MTDATSYTADAFKKYAALLIFAIAAAVDYSIGFVQGVLKARRELLARRAAAAAGATPFPSQPRPAARPVPAAPARTVPGKAYEVLCDSASEVTVNGIPIGHIDAAPWQFCSYDISYGNAAPRATKAQAFDDACDYAETIACSA